MKGKDAAMRTNWAFIAMISRAALIRGCMATLLSLAVAEGPAAKADEPEQLPPISERARKIHSAGMLFDGHNDLPWRLRSEGDFALTKFDLSRRLDSGQTDIPRLREGGVKAQFWSDLYPERAHRTWLRP